MFDWSVSVGNLLTILVVFGGAFIAYGATKQQVTALSESLKELEHELHRLTDILIAQGRQDERMTAMDARLVNQGARLDELTIRFNKKTDHIGTRVNE